MEAKFHTGGGILDFVVAAFIRDGVIRMIEHSNFSSHPLVDVAIKVDEIFLAEVRVPARFSGDWYFSFGGNDRVRAGIKRKVALVSSVVRDWSTVYNFERLARFLLFLGLRIIIAGINGGDMRNKLAEGLIYGNHFCPALLIGGNFEVLTFRSLQPDHDVRDTLVSAYHP